VIKKLRKSNAGIVADDVTCLLEAAKSGKARACGEADSLSQFDIRQPGVLLERGENIDVDTIEFRCACHPGETPF
jgi:hypothetical protein